MLTILTNYEIYNTAMAYKEFFQNFNSYIPVKVNFYLQKNMNKLAAAAEEIEKARLEIAKHYGVIAEDGSSYSVPEELIPQANQELNNLFSIEQELDIKKVSLEDFGNVEFTPQQMQVIMFMIDEE